MKSIFLIAACSTLSLAVSASAAPVTGWSVGLGTPSLSNSETSSPTLGNNTAENADNSALHASFPSITLAVGEKLTFSGSMQLSTGLGLTPTAYANEFRIGVFDVNGSANLNNWLGYYASAPSGATASGVRRRNASSAAYYSQTGTTLLYANSLTDTSKILEDATYDFSFSIERTATGMELNLSLENEFGYSIVPLSFEDTAPSTFTFNRVGFLAGNGLNADQLQFSNLDVSVVPEPTSIALLALGGLALFRIRSKR